MSLQSGDCDGPNRGARSDVASDTPMILDTYGLIRYDHHGSRRGLVALRRHAGCDPADVLI
jgi:hypothetical protein